MAKKLFKKWRSSTILISKSAFVYQISSKLNDFSLRNGDFTICLELSKFRVWHLAFMAMLFCFPVQNFIETGQSTAEFWPKKTIFKMLAICHFEFRGPIMGSLKSPCRTSHRSSTETIVLNFLVFEKIAFVCGFGDRQSNEQMDSFNA